MLCFLSSSNNFLNDKLFSNYSSITINNASWTSLIWVSELQLYIAVASNNASNTNTIK